MENNKLPKGTLENIPLSEVKNFITRTKEVGITTDTIRTKVYKAIESSDNERDYNSDSLTSKDFENIKKIFEYAGVDFGGENNKDEFFEKQWNEFRNFIKSDAEVRDIFYIFKIKTKEDFINTYTLHGFEWEGYIEGSFSLLRDFIQTDEDREKFLNALKNNLLFAHLIKRLKDGENIISKMKKDMDELIFLVGGDSEKSLLNFYGQNSLERVSGIAKHLPFLDENGKIIRDHHFFTEENFESFWKGEIENTKEIISLYELQTPEDFTKIYKHFYPNEDSFFLVNFQYINPKFFHNFGELHKSGKIEKEKLIKFFEKYILHNKKNTQILQKIDKFFLHPQFEEILEFFIKSKQKSIFDFLEKIRQFYELEKGFEIDFEFLKSTIIASENTEENILFEEKMGNILPMNEKEANQWKNAIRTKNIQTIKKISTERRMKMLFKNTENKIVAKIYEDFGEIAEENKEKLMRPEFLDAYKMSINPRYNKKHFREILSRYLQGDFDNIEEMRQFDTPKNQKWLAENLTEDQQKIWLSKNRREYNFEKNKNGKNSFEIEREHHIGVIHNKIREINMLGFNFDTNIADREILTDYFLDEIETKRTEITQKGGEYLLADIQFQFESMLVIDQQEKNSKNIYAKHKKVIIEREQDPLRVLMMGNCVNGSCLAFDSSTGNYFSTAANAIDANKTVFYLYNEENELLGRVLTTIGQDQKITRYKMYFAKEPDYSLDEIFNEYFRDLADKMNIRMNGSERMVQNIESEEWYKDGEVHVGEWW